MDFSNVSQKQLDRLMILTRREILILDDLHEVLMQQRRAVAESDREMVDTTVERSAELMEAHADVRAERESFLRECMGENVSLVYDPYDPEIPEPFKSEREVLQLRAQRVIRETAINRRILERVLAAGESLVKNVFEKVDQDSGTYSEESGKSGSILVNRMA